MVSCFVHKEPAYIDRYADHIPGPIEFGADVLLLKIPLNVCKVPNASANHENYTMALQQCEAMLAQLHSDQRTCKYRVQKMMLASARSAERGRSCRSAVYLQAHTGKAIKD